MMISGDFEQRKSTIASARLSKCDYFGH